jgi:hypothetical protein
MCPRLLALIALLFTPGGLTSVEPITGEDPACIIGAGPAGIQLALYYEQFGRPYAVYEQAAFAGSFYHTHPIARRLISENRRGYGELTDWNSLLLADRVPFYQIDDRFFPRAESLVVYLNEIVRAYNLTVVYNTRVAALGEDHIELADGTRLACKHVINACGLVHGDRLRRRHVTSGREYVVPYPETAEMAARDAFRGRAVAVIGMGNSAFETADSLSGPWGARSVHMYGRSRPRLAHESHYPGDVRGGSLAHLDRYHLKMGDAMVFWPAEALEDFALVPRALHTNDTRDGVWIVPDFDIDFQRKIAAVTRAAGNWTHPGRDRARQRRGSHPQARPRHAYDFVIDCTGFVPASPDLIAPYGDDFRMENGAYVAGALSHGRDYRKSAGGFIHGFRYQAAFLFNDINLGLFHHISAAELVDWIFSIFEQPAALVHMQGTYAHIAAFDEHGYVHVTAVAAPTLLMRERLRDVSPYFRITFRWNCPEFCSPGGPVDVLHPDAAVGYQSCGAVTSNFIHPVIQYIDIDGNIADRVDLMENPDLDFTDPYEYRMMIDRFVSLVYAEEHGLDPKRAVLAVAERYEDPCVRFGVSDCRCWMWEGLRAEGEGDD